MVKVSCFVGGRKGLEGIKKRKKTKGEKEKGAAYSLFLIPQIFFPFKSKIKGIENFLPSFDLLPRVQRYN